MIKQTYTTKLIEDKSSKSTLEIYNKFNINIKEENQVYDNSEESIILFRARTNPLPLNWRNPHKPNTNDQLCPM